MVKDFNPRIEIEEDQQSEIKVEDQIVEHTPDDTLKDQGVGGYMDLF